MEKLFIIGDIHGRLDMLTKLLEEWNREDEHLIILGDYIDRGPQSKDVLELVFNLKDTYDNVTLLKGNHEEMFLSFLDDPNNMANLYLPQGGLQTIGSLLDNKEPYAFTAEYLAKRVKDQFPELVDKIQALPYYHVIGDLVFVHAGVDLRLEHSWEMTRDSDFCWMREPFFTITNNTGKTFFFGHTVTRTLHPKVAGNNNNIWFSKDKTRIGIDGGAVFGGYLHGLHIVNQDVKNVYINQKLELCEGITFTL